MRTASRRADPPTRSDRGEITSAVILIPVALAVVVLLVQTVLVFHARAVVTAAATDAARAIQAEGGSIDDGRAVATEILDGSRSLLQGPTVEVTSDGDRVHANVRADVTSLVPGWTPTVSATIDGDLETFRPSQP